ncbi:hypothetical protein S7711_11193 [Stachybotrys chartarum IBT 7711]|uniref:Uncharacterized protein n=1 Tax=Stachybotrys chartarum (strain CBS 109288 / IBT 7711) TaxID=1280523 RepID=A0A084ASQ0_STACB|nr:hypothetical protein S7711_11193 [Stachybotrys chartarum IBT 7711]KFA49779.1 hypothetical protein S40293_10502 [Stachybotrys chartarum IBT 40293]
MLSVKYHITYWAAAAWAVASYRVLASCSLCVTAFRLIIGPLAACTTYASFQWHRNSSKRANLALYSHQALIACLLVALGSVADYFQLPDEEMPKPTALIHLLSAFITVGVLESLRQNRSDIEPASFRLVQSGPRTQLYCWSWQCIPVCLTLVIACDAILFAILLATDRALHHSGGMSLQHIVPYWGWEDMQYPGRLGSAVVAHYLGGPFADMAETIFYALCRIFVPHMAGPRGWTPKSGPLRIPVFPFLSPYLEVFKYALFWLPRMLLPRYQYGDGASVDGPRWGIFVGLLRVMAGF